jgi:predicted Rossmann fold nucleotide-binding protein DprA/Smf involved in DNA uptake
MAEASVAALLLTNRIAQVDAKPFAAGEFWDLVERIGDLGTLLGVSSEDIKRRFALDSDASERIARLLGAALPFTLVREELVSQGITMLAALDEAYPQRLRERLGRGAPPMLYAAGPIAWLEDRGVAIVGSRDVTEEGGEVARKVARAAADVGLATISGAARGVDQLAMGAALEVEAPVVGVPTEGIRKAGRTSEMRRLLTDGRICLASPYMPDMGFTAANAMARNKVVYALSAATVVVASAEDSGGTWNGAVEAIRNKYCPVLAWRGAGEGPGNEALVERGARPIDDVSAAVAIALGSQSSKDAGRQLSLLTAGARPEEPPHVGDVAGPDVVDVEAPDVTSEVDRFLRERLEPMGLSAATINSYKRGAKLFAEWRRTRTG